MMRRARLFAALVLGLSCVGAEAAPIGYAVSSDNPQSSATDSLYRIDLATGQATRVGAVGFADVEGLAIDPDGVLYGVDDATDTLITIDTGSGQGTPVGDRVGNLGLSGQGGTFGALDYGLAFACDGSLLLSSDTASRSWVLNRASGEAGEPRNASGNLSGLAARGDEVYGIGSEGMENLYSLDPESGATSLIGSLGASWSYDDAGLDFAEDGTLWAVLDHAQAGSQPSDIVRINVETGAATLVAETLPGFESLAIAPPVCGPIGGGPVVTAIPTLSGWGMTLLAALVALLAAVHLRRANLHA